MTAGEEELSDRHLAHADGGNGDADLGIVWIGSLHPAFHPLQIRQDLPVDQRSDIVIHFDGHGGLQGMSEKPKVSSGCLYVSDDRLHAVGGEVVRTRMEGGDPPDRANGIQREAWRDSSVSASL